MVCTAVYGSGPLFAPASIEYSPLYPTSFEILMASASLYRSGL